MSNSFKQLGLSENLCTAVKLLGYETPTPIQEAAIPVLLKHHDLLAQAQTGTGKTAAFALPILANINPSVPHTQALVMVPTRELAMQVAQAIEGYATHLKGLLVTAITGGQSYRNQLKALKQGTHIIVATPGRAIDHLQRKTLKTQHIRIVILDEADEMLKMGFKEDIEQILGQIKQKYQVGLFSATFPKSIEAITKRYLKNAEKIHIKPSKTNLNAIEQCYIRAEESQKFNVLARILEIEDVDAGIIFARTKSKSSELAEKLKDRGQRAAALNGDMNQSHRQQVLDQFKQGSLDIIVATDVAARGIDVDRISHVVNYDIPYDSEYYTHRIGRTGRAGRTGKAFLLVTSREYRLLRDIERATKKPIKPMEPPSIKAMRDKRMHTIEKSLIELLSQKEKWARQHEMIQTIIDNNTFQADELAAALLYLNQQHNPLPTENIKAPKKAEPQKRRPTKPFKKESRRRHTTDKKMSKKHHVKTHNKSKRKKSRVANA